MEHCIFSRETDSWWNLIVKESFHFLTFLLLIFAFSSIIVNIIKLPRLKLLWHCWMFLPTPNWRKKSHMNSAQLFNLLFRPNRDSRVIGPFGQNTILWISVKSRDFEPITNGKKDTYNYLLLYFCPNLYLCFGCIKRRLWYKKNVVILMLFWQKKNVHKKWKDLVQHWWTNIILLFSSNLASVHMKKNGK